MESLTTLSELGAEVARLRNEKNMTQLQLAKQVGLGQSTLARFETGKVAEFGAAKLLRLLDALNYEVSLVPSGSRPTLDSMLTEKRRGSR